MKKIAALFLCLFLLCGCEYKPQEYLITAIGFDYGGGLYTVSVEALIINTENEDSQLKVITSKGETLKKAVNDIQNQITLPALFSHCGIVAVGGGISGDGLKDIMKYCKNHDEINLSVRFIKTENASKLLKTEPQSSISVGYDLMSMIKTYEEEKSESVKNRLFEIYEDESPVLPIINTQEKGYYFAKH